MTQAFALRHDTFVDTLWEGLTDPVCGQMMGLTAENLAIKVGAPIIGLIDSGGARIQEGLG